MIRENYNPVIAVDPENYKLLWISAIGYEYLKVPNSVLIRGEAAHYLYLALTGHALEQHPAEFSHILANSARAVILSRVGEGEDWRSALSVLRSSGSLIRPWLGMGLYDKDLNPMFNALEHQRFDAKGKGMWKI